jgi:hypothetical protein
MIVRPVVLINTHVVCSDLFISMSSFNRRNPGPLGSYGDYSHSSINFRYIRRLPWDYAYPISIILEPSL